jgi:hypothetical protein
MKHAPLYRCVGALAVLALFGAACSNSDDVAGVQEIVETSNVSDEPADTAVTTDDQPATVDSEPADAGEQSADQSELTGGYVFTAPTGDYVITFPGEPTATPLPIPLPTGQVTADAFIYEDGDDAAYFTSVFDYPEGAIDADPEAVLVGARDGAIANVGGTLVDSEFIERDGVSGVAFSFEVADGATAGDGRALVFVDGLRLYQSFALGFSGQSDQFQAFLDTFMFTADQAGDS